MKNTEAAVYSGPSGINMYHGIMSNNKFINCCTGFSLVCCYEIENNWIECYLGGVGLRACSNCSISNNTIKGLEHRIYGNLSVGIYIEGGFHPGNISLVANHVFSNKYGLMLTACNYDVYGNYIIGNTIEENEYGIYFFGGLTGEEVHDNYIYHNNFLSNVNQVFFNLSWCAGQNIWDNGCPFGGNYWSDYNGTDLFSGSYQNETGSDGLGDSPYVIDENNIDHYPLMGPFSSFNTSVGYSVDVISNSTIEDFQYFQSNNTIVMYVSNMTANQTAGFCRITIPHDVMSPPYTIKVNETTIDYNTIYENYTEGISIVYFTYKHSKLEITVILEYPSTTILLPLMLTTIITTILLKRKRKPKPQPIP